MVLLILGYAMRLAAKVAQPISDKLALDQLGDFSGIGAVTVLAVLVLIVESFAAGIVARTDLGERISRWFENSLLGGLPQYQLLKSMAEGLAQVESSNRRATAPSRARSRARPCTRREERERVGRARASAKTSVAGRHRFSRPGTLRLPDVLEARRDSSRPIP